MMRMGFSLDEPSLTLMLPSYWPAAGTMLFLPLCGLGLDMLSPQLTRFLIDNVLEVGKSAGEVGALLVVRKPFNTDAMCAMLEKEFAARKT